jgi:hypothetical protein
MTIWLIRYSRPFYGKIVLAGLLLNTAKCSLTLSNYRLVVGVYTKY